jgi:hypothetical protein
MNVAYQALEFTSFGKNLRAVEVPGGKVSVSLVQEFTLSDMKAVTYNQIGDIYLAMMQFAKQHNLTLIDSETKALAFLMNTHGVGSLWFDGRFLRIFRPLSTLMLRLVLRSLAMKRRATLALMGCFSVTNRSITPRKSTSTGWHPRTG